MPPLEEPAVHTAAEQTAEETDLSDQVMWHNYLSATFEYNLID